MTTAPCYGLIALGADNLDEALSRILQLLNEGLHNAVRLGSHL
jgi:hypothetical protein